MPRSCARFLPVCVFGILYARAHRSALLQLVRVQGRGVSGLADCLLSLFVAFALLDAPPLEHPRPAYLADLLLFAYYLHTHTNYLHPQTFTHTHTHLTACWSCPLDMPRFLRDFYLCVCVFGIIYARAPRSALLQGVRAQGWSVSGLADCPLSFFVAFALLDAPPA